MCGHLIMEMVRVLSDRAHKAKSECAYIILRLVAARCMLLHELHGLPPESYCYLVCVFSLCVGVCVGV